VTDRKGSPHSLGMSDTIAFGNAASVPRSDARIPLAQVYDAHAAYVFRVLRRLGVPEPHIDDAVQDVFMVVLTRAAEFEGRSSLRTWIFGIALRVARAQRRSRGRIEHDVHELEIEAQTPAPDEQTEHAREVRLLARLLESLDDAQREVFVLADIEGLTAPEIAEALGVKLNTVYSRLRLARQRFEAAFARHRAREARRTP
jgi:RNA polymerase sigma-70 factor, ECF subfamily